MNILTNLPLIAAGEVWEMVIGAIFFILWIVGQLMGNRNEAKQKKQARRPRPPQPVEAPVAEAQGQGPPKQEDALRNEVEEFLRRAQGKPPREKEPAQREQPVRQLREEPPPRRPRPEKKRPQRPQPVATRPKPSTTDMRHEGVAEHVTKHMSMQETATRIAALGDEVEQADEKLEAHLHEKFDHQLGSLQHEDKQKVASKRTDVAADIADMLSRPEGMRQLIVANEILKRPEW